MRRRGGLRPVQIDAIATYLFLKSQCGNRPLCEIFSSGRLNTIRPDDLRLSRAARDFLVAHPASLALYEFASQPNGSSILSPQIKARLESAPESIDATAIFRRLFRDISYPDYLFSLPMGAGKTFLMAAFLYLDLAFATQEPDNPAFAHNFLILAPSGLKSSIVPSLRTIQAFDPTWVVPDPLATTLRRLLKFVVLDADASASRSNRVRNPNVQKLTSFQPFHDLMGLVAVTNAEKVILDRVEVDLAERLLIERTEDEKTAQANELRATIAKIPSLSIFIDEAHHADDTEIKLRAVVSKWAESGRVNTVLGFSGTPYLSSPEKIPVANDLDIRTSEIASTVHYFPLVEGIGRFLKKPTVHIVRDAADPLAIVRRGIEEFLAAYRDKRYASGACAKLAIYCGSIERLEESVYPLAVELCRERGLDPAAAVLRYHRGNKAHPAPADSDLAFASLDMPYSPVRIVLLVQIGKEGWDCRSLAGVVLSQEGDCPRNMVLQTSCRCLREVDHGVEEEAVIFLNESNGKLLADQLRKQQHTDLDEFQRGAPRIVAVERHDRTGILRLPPLPFWQLRVAYEAEPMVDDTPPSARLDALLAALPSMRRRESVQTGSFTDLRSGGIADAASPYDPAHPFGADYRPACPFRDWTDLLERESFGFWHVGDIADADLERLRAIHAQVSAKEADGTVFLSPDFDQAAVRSQVLAAFWPHRELSVREEEIPQSARLLRVERLTSPIDVAEEKLSDYVPDTAECARIVLADQKGSTASEAVDRAKAKLAQAEADGDPEEIAFFRAKLEQAMTGQGGKDRSYHYLPYHTDSRFERAFLDEALHRTELAAHRLEIYYNGDRSLTEFRIRCYRKRAIGSAEQWVGVGDYTPDFLVLRRDAATNAIDACMVVETKGALYARDPAFQHRRHFAETTFLDLQNRPGLPRYRYLYLEESADWERQFLDAIKEFFT